MFKMKNITVLVLIVSLISLSQLSCTKTTTQKITQSDTESNFTLFTPISTEYPAVNNPTLTWTYHWPEDYDKVLEAKTPPRADNDGNCYFVGKNCYLYSLNPSGEVRWNKKFGTGVYDYYGNDAPEKLIITEEGVLARSESLNLISLDGKIFWEKEDITEDIFLSPNGTLFCFTTDGNLIGLDANGKTMWSNDIFQDSILDGNFFDSNSNGYFLVADLDSNNQGIGYFILSVSPTGELRWKKNLHISKLNSILEFLPNDTIQDTFLLAYTNQPDEDQEDYYKILYQNEKVIKAYNLDCEIIWEKTITSHGEYISKYAVDQENNFYTVFNERDYDAAHTPLIRSYLSCFSKEGTKVWEKTFDSEIEHCPTLDKDHNVYLWIDGSDYNMFSTYPDGELRWKYYSELSNGCKFPITLSPVGSIFTTSKNQSLMFCVK